MFKNWIRDMFDLSNIKFDDDVNIDIAKANYQKYQDDLKEKQTNYIKTVCGRIKVASRDGDKFIDTFALRDEAFMTYEFMMEMKEYFEHRGFKVVEKRNCYGAIKTWLRISWDEEDK